MEVKQKSENISFFYHLLASSENLIFRMGIVIDIQKPCF